MSSVTQDRQPVKRVAIIGAGWSGLQCAQVLQEKGIDFEIFDKNSMLGGTWSSEMSYSQLSLHSARWINMMTINGKFLPWKSQDKEYLAQRAPAAEVLQYLTDFVSKCGLESKIHSNSVVKEVQYDSESRLANLVVQKDSETTNIGPFNLVVFASLSGVPRMPDIPDRGFEGKLLHSCQLKDETMADIVKSNSKVVVIGAGKSACDMLQAFQSVSYENVKWLCREPYWFFKYRTFFHDGSITSMLHAVLCLVFFLCVLVCPTVSMVGLWAIGYTIMPGWSGWPKHFNAIRFHFGVLSDQQIDFIRKVKPMICEPDHFHKTGVVLKSGETVDCDVVICATGYNTGVDSLQYVKDGAPVTVADIPLYEHAIVPRFPCLVVAPTAFYHFGPIRGVTLGEYVAHVLERKPINPELMEQTANSNLCTQTSSHHVGYSNTQAFGKQWLLFYIDLWRTGLISIGAVLNVSVSTFVLLRYVPLRLNVSQ